MNNIGATQGIQAWMRAFDGSATTVNNAAAKLADDSTGSADLVDGMVGMSLSASGVRAGVAIVRTQDQMLGTLLDMFA
jgi:hypothetical protein